MTDRGQKLKPEWYQPIAIVFEKTQLTQVELARAFGVHPSRIKQIVRAQRQPAPQVPGQVTIEQAIEEAEGADPGSRSGESGSR